jgi:uncharacterized protein YoxC
MTAQELFYGFVSIFLVPLCLFLVSIWIKRLFKASDEIKEDSEKKIAELLQKQEDIKEKATLEWRATYNQDQRDIKGKVEEIAKVVTEKVSYRHCEETEKELWQAIEKIKNGFRGT